MLSQSALGTSLSLSSNNARSAGGCLAYSAAGYKHRTSCLIFWPLVPAVYTRVQQSPFCRAQDEKNTICCISGWGGSLETIYTQEDLPCKIQGGKANRISSFAFLKHLSCCRFHTQRTISSESHHSDTESNNKTHFPRIGFK